MSAAAHEIERGWDIPSYIWPPVLGVSVALHLSVLVFGLPEMSWPQQETETLRETEIIIESGGVVFEEVATSETPPLEAVTAGAVAVVEPESTALLPAGPADSPALEPVASDLLPAAGEATEVIEQVEVSELAPSGAVEAVAARVAEASQVAPETVILPQVLTNESVVAEPVEAVQSAVVPLSTQGQVPDPSVPTLANVEDTAPVIAVQVPISPVGSEEIAEIAEVAPVPVEVPTLEAGAVALLVPVGEETDELMTAPDAGIPAEAVPASVEVAPVATEDAAPVGPAPPEAASLAPVGGVQVPAAPQALSAAPAPEAMLQTPVAVAGDSVEVMSAAAPDVAVVTAAQPETAAVQPAETVVAAISPSDPVTDAVPAVAPPSEPAETAPVAEVATIDPLAKVTRYVANYDLGDCAHVSVLAAGPDSAKVTAFGAGIGPFARFDQRFSSDQGYEAAIELRLVTPRQCALLNALGVSGGIDAAGLVELDRTVVRSGTPVSGLIQRDLPLERIAVAAQTGLDLGGKGPPELYLIDDAGQIHDGREFLLPAPSARTAGAWRFEVPVTLMASQSEETALVLAVWNRPAARQPARFGVLPSERIAAILSEPGVYSLSAFKVSP